MPEYESFSRLSPWLIQRLLNAVWLIEPSGFASNVLNDIPALGTPFGYTAFAARGTALSGWSVGSVPRLALRWLDA